MTRPPDSGLLVRVEAAWMEAEDIRVLRLVAEGGGMLPAFEAGAHVDVHLGANLGANLGADLVRQYSLCGDPADRSAYLIAVKREADSRGGSRRLHEATAIGAMLTIGEPRNQFPLETAAGHHVLVAGGIGVTPMMSMLSRLQLVAASFELHLFSRSGNRTAFLGRLAAPELAGRVTLHTGLDPDGAADALRRVLAHRPPGAHLYLCGPRPFMAIAGAIAAVAWPAACVHVEHFSADPAKAPAPAADFVVQLAKTGGEYPVAAGQTIVSALAEHEIYIDTSCEEGVCGTCTLDVLDGVPDHRDEVLTPAERQSGRRIVTCVSRALSPVIVLDF